LQFLGQRDVLADGTAGSSTAIVTRAVVNHARDLPPDMSVASSQNSHVTTSPPRNGVAGRTDDH
jgi:hypothetical protein